MPALHGCHLAQSVSTEAAFPRTRFLVWATRDPSPAAARGSAPGRAGPRQVWSSYLFGTSWLMASAPEPQPRSPSLSHVQDRAARRPGRRPPPASALMLALSSGDTRPAHVRESAHLPGSGSGVQAGAALTAQPQPERQLRARLKASTAPGSQNCSSGSGRSAVSCADALDRFLSHCACFLLSNGNSSSCSKGWEQPSRCGSVLSVDL